MNKKVIKPIVLVALFFVAIIIFSITTNKDNRDMTTTMAKATLPVMYFQQGDNQINELHGYVNKMDVTQMRDSITPVDDTRILPVIVHTYGKKSMPCAMRYAAWTGRDLLQKATLPTIKLPGTK